MFQPRGVIRRDAKRYPIGQAKIKGPSERPEVQFRLVAFRPCQARAVLAIQKAKGNKASIAESATDLNLLDCSCRAFPRRQTKLPEFTAGRLDHRRINN